jgi:hypothetical protein
MHEIEAEPTYVSRDEFITLPLHGPEPAIVEGNRWLRRRQPSGWDLCEVKDGKVVVRPVRVKA